MSVKTFVDTNVLIYAHDAAAGQKRDVARNLLTQLWEDGTGVLSMQVLQEFYVNVIRKLAAPIPRPSARRVVTDYSRWCVATSMEDVSLAFQIEDSAGLSFWDALIVASAARCGATKLASEDLNNGQTIMGVTIENPFV